MDFRLLYVSAADRKTGIVRRKQIDLARMFGTHRRTIQRCRDRLVSFGYLGPVAQKPGGYVSAYNVLASEKAARVSPFIKGGVDEGGVDVKKGGPATAHVPLLSLDVPSEPSRDTEPERGSRRALTALDPLGLEISKQVGTDFFYSWFTLGEAEIVERTDDAITLAVKSQLFATYITNQYEPVIARCAGVTRADVVVRQAAAPRPTP